MPQSRKQLLDPSKARDIEQKLSAIGKKNLYDFLALDAMTQPVVLFDKAKVLYDGIQRMATKDSQAIVTSQLAGVCMELFKTAADKKRYDDTIADRMYDPLRKQIDLILAHSITIHLRQLELLLRYAEQVGLNKDDTFTEILIHLQKKVRPYA